MKLCLPVHKQKCHFTMLNIFTYSKLSMKHTMYMYTVLQLVHYIFLLKLWFFVTLAHFLLAKSWDVSQDPLS